MKQNQRDQLLAIVSAQLDRVVAEQAPIAVLEPGALDHARRLAEALPKDGLDLEALQILGWFHWYRFQALPEDQDRDDLQAAVAAFTPCLLHGVKPVPEPLLPLLGDTAAAPAAALLRRALGSAADPDLIIFVVRVWERIVQATPADHPDHAGRLSNLGVALQTRFERSGSATDLDEAICVIRQAAQATPIDHPDRAMYLYNLGGALLHRFERTGSTADLDEAFSVCRQAVAATPTDQPNHARYLSGLGLALQHRFERTGDLADLDEGVNAVRQAAQATPPDDPDRAGRLSGLVSALLCRFERTGSAADLDEMISVDRQAVTATPTDHPAHAMYMSRLALALGRRFDRTGSAADLDEAIRIGQQALAATPLDHPDRAGRLFNLGHALRFRFDRTGSAADLDEAIRIGQQALAATSPDHPNHTTILANLGDALRRRFERTGSAADLDEAIRIGQQAVQATSPDHPYHTTMLANLGHALRFRFDRTGSTTDLDEAIHVGRQAVQATSPDHPYHTAILANFGDTLQRRFGRIGDLADLDEAIRIGRQALAATPPDDPNHTAILANFGGALRLRFGRIGDLADLDEAIRIGRQALAATPPDHPNHAPYLFNLGGALRLRFERTGSATDLDEAIHVGRQAVHATPADHPDHAMYLSGLGSALQRRFERTGSATDLDEAISVDRQALAATPPDHPDQARRLSALGFALRHRFERTGSATDLDEAISVDRQALAATPPDHPDRAMHLSGLGSALQHRFGRTGDLADLDEALNVGRQAVHATPADHPDHAMYLSNLGGTLALRSERTGSATDLDEAIRVGRRAVQATPADHPDRAGRLSNLALALHARFGRTRSADDLDEATSVYAEVVDLDMAAPSLRILAARSAVALGGGADARWAARLLEVAVGLLAETTPRQLTRADQQHALGGFAGLASQAAAFALTANEGECSPAKALQLLELGRAVLLGQALETRTDLTDLQTRDPALAKRFTELRDLLDWPDRAQTGLADMVPTPDRAGHALAGAQPRDRHALVADFNAVIAQIRGLEGFRTFLRPPSVAQLTEQAQAGPVVVFTISEERSDALILRPDGVTLLPLPALERTTLTEKIISFYTALPITASRKATREERLAAQAGLHDILEWLWDGAAEPVLDQLGYTYSPSAGERWPRVWWAPGGLLGLLPIHAAGYHRHTPAAAGGKSVLDRVVSSYIPTVRALRHARERPAAGPLSAVIVAMPTTPGAAGLHYVIEEAQRVHAHLPQAAVYDDGETTTTMVLDQLAGCAIAHLACHGSSDPADPSHNRLLLRDHETDPLTVARLAPVRLDRARLAYLSACQTAFSGAAALLDEAIHLASAFQMAGFPQVIGTLWPIDDALSARIADAFYQTLEGGDGVLDTSRAAEALHVAVRETRDRFPALPSLWAPYMHAGA